MKDIKYSKFNCNICKKPLTEQELFEIQEAHAPCIHYSCFIKKNFKGKLNVI